MTDQNAIVTEGRDAWERIKGTRPLFSDWLAIGRALLVGKAQCLRQAGSNRPYGPVYMKSMRAWLDSAGLGDVETQERRGAIFIAEHEAEVTAWRQNLSPSEARNANHPSTIVKHFQAGTRPQARGPKKERQEEGHAAPAEPFVPLDGADFTWPDEARRRVILALRNTRGQPLPVMVDAALKAAIRCSADYRALKSCAAPAKAATRAATLAAATEPMHA